jgi:hypothetical protein
MGRPVSRSAPCRLNISPTFGRAVCRGEAGHHLGSLFWAGRAAGLAALGLADPGVAGHRDFDLAAFRHAGFGSTWNPPKLKTGESRHRSPNQQVRGPEVAGVSRQVDRNIIVH